jgi:NADH:ubiquinone oxidoreductase subunit K
MDNLLVNIFLSFSVFVIMLFVIGVYCIMASYNLIRVLIGVELLIKAATLLVIICGYVTGHLALMQSLVITMIVIEAVLITVAVGIVLGIHRRNGSLDARSIRNLKG